MLNYVYECVFKWACEHEHGIHGGQRHQIPLELALKTAVSQPT